MKELVYLVTYDNSVITYLPSTAFLLRFFEVGHMMMMLCIVQLILM